MAAAPSETLDLCKILSETWHIIKSHSSHIQLLSLVFLLPLSLSILIYPIVHQTIFDYQPLSTLLAQVLVNLLYIFFVTVLSVCGTASISYSAFQLAFYGIPIELVTSVKSILQSFFPLASTLMIQEVCLALISLPFVYLVVQIYESESFTNQTHPYYIAFIILLSLVSLLVLINLQVKWMLASVIAVVESKWGLEPMKRSAQLVKGKKGVALSMVVFFGVIVGAHFWAFYTTREIWGFISCLAYLTVVLYFYLVANVVFYVCCVKMHGEVVLPISPIKEVPLLK